MQIQPPCPATSKRWGVELFRHGEAPGHLDLEAEDEVTADGTWTSMGLAPGDYILRVRGGPEASWHQEEITIPAGIETVLRELELPAEWVAGRVLLGAEPVAAELYFVAQQGTVRAPARSNAEGLFEALVPRREDWTIDAFARELSVSHRFPEAELEWQDEEDRRWVELVIPDTLVEGTVVEDQGLPAAGAHVRASGRSGGQRQQCGAEGGFVLRGLRAGSYWLSAQSSDRRSRSEMVQVNVDPDEPTPVVELTLKSDRRIDGQVIAPSGQGVVGARIVGLIEQTHESRIASVIPETTTDLTGSFSLEIPERAEGVLLTAFPPGFAARQIRVDSRSSQPALIPVEPHGGTLRIRYEEPVQRDRLVIFKTWQLPLHFTLTNWATFHGEPNQTPDLYSIPMLEPGYYQVCTDSTYMFQMTGRLEPELESRCHGGYLPAYGELVIDLR